MPIDPAWHREQIEKYIAVRPHYVQYADLLRRSLEGALASMGAMAIVQARPKAVPSFAEKAIRKAAKYRDPVNQLTDLCGARVITHTQEQVEQVCAFLRENFEIDWVNSVDVRTRLRTGEFGYLSVHYVLQLRRGAMVGGEVPVELRGLKAEIQVRTIIQHAWADIGHDRLYKNDFVVPEVWHRVAARVAAMLEQADQSFGELTAAVDAYAAEHAAYMTQAQMDAEMETLEAIIASGEASEAMRLRVARIARAARRWDRAVAALRPASRTPEVCRELGFALCQLESDAGAHTAGRALLEAALGRDPRDAVAATWLAATCGDAGRARALRRQAFEADPRDPYRLVATLADDLGDTLGPAALRMMRPMLEAAVARCREHADLGIHLPDARFTAGRLLLLLAKGEEAVEEFTLALDVTLAKGSGVSAGLIAEEIAFLDGVERHKDAMPGHGAVRALLLLAAAGAPSAGGPALVVVGVEGTADGSARWVADALTGRRATALCEAATGDPLAELEHALMSLTGLGASVADLRVIGLGGGAAAGMLARVLLALGATVGMVVRSGGAADAALADARWGTHDRLAALPAEPLMLRLFFDGPPPRLAEPLRQPIAEGVHAAYVAERRAALVSGDRSLLPWDKLDPGLRESNAQQADHMVVKLASIGYTVAPGGEPVVLTKAEIETLSELEHARWVIERLLAGWRLGDKDVAQRRSPWLIGWAGLPEDIREYDREAVRRIPGVLAAVGLGGRR